MPRTPSSIRGFSLAELMVVVAIVGLMSALLGASMERSHGFAKTEMSRTTAESRFQHAFDHFRNVLAIARVDPPIDSGTRVRHQLPIDHDGNGLAYDETGAITWGWTQGGVPTLGDSAWFVFVADSTVTEATLDFDVDHDGDSTDSYDLGHVEQQLPDGTPIVLTGSNVLQRAGNPGADMNGDGVLDPLFAVDDTGRSRLARIHVFGLYRLSDSRWQRVEYDASVRLQNDEH